MKYISTRGASESLGFKDAVMTGLARDGGLLLPETFPTVDEATLARWAELDYPALAVEVMLPFVDLARADLEELVERSYRTFRHPDVVPTVAVGDLHVMELFHGPTLAFKDIALQFLGNLFEYILRETGQQLNILAATSGDTGSAAIHGVRGRSGISIFVMHPDGRVSPTQERQMTSVLDENVHNLAIQGTFDDCQRIMKNIFGNLQFRDRYSLGSVNSINWARLLAQIVYYFYSGLDVMKKSGADRVSFSVPTGNFGDILAGYIAAKMGLPVDQLVLATNENDILSRFFSTGEYSLGDVHPTLSPSMDIQVASNFERYLFYFMGRDGARIRDMMQDFASTGRLEVPLGESEVVDPLFAAGVGTTEDTLQAIRRYQDSYGYLLDPHTAVGVHVAEQVRREGIPMICLATAHPAKFSAAIQQATGEDLAHHPVLDALEGLPTRKDKLAADEHAVESFIEQSLSADSGSQEI